MARKDTSETMRALLGDIKPPTTAPEETKPDPAPPVQRTRQPRPIKPATAPQDEDHEPAPTANPLKLTQPRIPASLFAAIREAKKGTDDTHEMWFVDAFNSVDDELDTHYARKRPEGRMRLRSRQRRARQATEDPLVSYPLRLDDEERRVLEERAEELKPISMSEFVTTIVRLRLKQLGGGRS